MRDDRTIWDLVTSDKGVAPVERKSAGVFTPSLFDALFLQSSSAYSVLSFTQAMNFFAACAPLYDAVDTLCKGFAGITPVLYDKKKDQFVSDHDLLSLLEHPHPAMDWYDWAYALAAYYILCGNSYPYALGRVDKPPVELGIAQAQFTVAQQARDGYAGSFTYSLNGPNGVCWERHDVKRRWRYYNEAKDNELLHVAQFIPGIGGALLYGMSKLNPIYRQIEQQNAANLHNLSLLQRGARPSALFGVPGELTDAQFTRLQQQINDYYAGAGNAGRPILGEGGLTVNDLMQSNRDMDFLSLKKDSRVEMYNVLDIPLALIDTNVMTYDNLENANLALYEQGVLPLTNYLLQKLGLWLLPRYGASSKDLVLTYDARTVQPLQYRSMQTARAMKETTVFTDNEIRTTNGWEAYEGGDVVYKPSTLLPVGEDRDVVPVNASSGQDDDEEPMEREEGEELEERYVALLLQMKNALGAPVYTEQSARAAWRKSLGKQA